MNETNWNEESIEQLYELPFMELVHRAYAIHKKHFETTTMELCTLLSIKTGACPEDCAYCPQSGHFKTDVKKEKLLDINVVMHQAKLAKKSGAKRFCMGAAWKNPPKQEFVKVLEMIKEVKALGLETCVTLGMLNNEQALELKDAGLDFYNHNLDTSPQYYEKIITTRTYQDRLDTLKHVRDAGVNVCCGGIIGMGESRQDRINFLLQLLKLPKPPESVPINKLIPIKGTPLGDTTPIDNFEFIKTIAITRIALPKSVVRLSAGREDMSDEMQAWCFMAGANSIFYGDVLLTAANPSQNNDLDLLEKLGIKTQKRILETEDKSC